MMIPKIDPDVKYIGSSKLRDLTATELRALTGAIVVTGAQNTPLAVILPYETYMALQNTVRIAMQVRSVEQFSSDTANTTRLDAIGPELSSGRGRVTTETRGPRQKGDTKR